VAVAGCLIAAKPTSYIWGCDHQHNACCTTFYPEPSHVCGMAPRVALITGAGGMLQLLVTEHSGTDAARVHATSHHTGLQCQMHGASSHNLAHHRIQMTSKNEDWATHAFVSPQAVALGGPRHWRSARQMHSRCEQSVNAANQQHLQITTIVAARLTRGSKRVIKSLYGQPAPWSHICVHGSAGRGNRRQR
jgi:hypothetical protein